MYAIMKEREEIIENFLSSMTPLIRQMYSKRTLVEELAPFILCVIAPHLQTVRHDIIDQVEYRFVDRLNVIPCFR